MPLERLTAALFDPFRIAREIGAGKGDKARPGGKRVAALAGPDGPPVAWPEVVKGADAAPGARTEPITGAIADRAHRMDSPLVGAGAVIGCDIAGWLMISGMAHLVAAHPDPFVTFTIFWVSQFCWGVALALYFGRHEMARARSVVIFLLGTAFMLTLGSLGIAFLWSGGL